MGMTSARGTTSAESARSSSSTRTSPTFPSTSKRRSISISFLETEPSSARSRTKHKDRRDGAEKHHRYQNSIASIATHQNLDNSMDGGVDIISVGKCRRLVRIPKNLF